MQITFMSDKIYFIGWTTSKLIVQVNNRFMGEENKSQPILCEIWPKMTEGSNTLLQEELLGQPIKATKKQTMTSIHFEWLSNLPVQMTPHDEKELKSGGPRGTAVI